MWNVTLVHDVNVVVSVSTFASNFATNYAVCITVDKIYTYIYIYIYEKKNGYLLHTMEIAIRETIKTTPAAADPAIKGSCSLSSDLKSSGLQRENRQTVMFLFGYVCIYSKLILWEKL